MSPEHGYDTHAPAFRSTATGKVSVIMPAYNAESYIRQAADSVLQQDYANLELIIVDDGSSDATPALARAIAATDARVVLIEQPNSGKPSVARNAGIAQADGQYLSFLDSDDYWRPGRVASLVEGMLAHPDWVASFHDVQLTTFDDQALPGTYLGNVDFPAVVGPGVVKLDGDWHECSEDFFAFMSLRFAAIHTQSVLIDRRRLGPDDARFDERFTICEDTDLWIRLALQGRIGYLAQVLSCYRQNPVSITRNPVLFAEQALAFHRFNRERLSCRMDQAQMASYARKVASLARQLAYHYSRAGLLERARAASRMAWREDAQWIDLAMFAKALVPLSVRRILR